MKDNEFVIFYAKDDVIYPVLLDCDQDKSVQMVIRAVLGDNIKVIDKPQGELETGGVKG